MRHIVVSKMFARPKCGESEEDILKLQEEFLRNTQPKSSAAVLRKRKSGDENEGNSGTYTTGVR
jgi:hypothetical protein